MSRSQNNDSDIARAKISFPCTVNLQVCTTSECE